MSKMPVSSGEFLENLPGKSLPIEIFCWAFTLTLSQLEFGRDDWSAVKGDAARSLCGGICGGAKNLGKTTKKRPKEKILQGRFPDIRNFRQKSFMNEILVGIPISWVEVLGFPPKGSRISREKTNPGCLFFVRLTWRTRKYWKRKHQEIGHTWAYSLYSIHSLLLLRERFVTGLWFLVEMYRGTPG